MLKGVKTKYELADVINNNPRAREAFKRTLEPAREAYSREDFDSLAVDVLLELDMPVGHKSHYKFLRMVSSLIIDQYKTKEEKEQARQRNYVDYGCRVAEEEIAKNPEAQQILDKAIADSIELRKSGKSGLFVPHEELRPLIMKKEAQGHGYKVMIGHKVVGHSSDHFDLVIQRLITMKLEQLGFSSIPESQRNLPSIDEVLEKKSGEQIERKEKLTQFVTVLQRVADKANKPVGQILKDGDGEKKF